MSDTARGDEPSGMAIGYDGVGAGVGDGVEVAVCEL
jgi:hypothetical protein